MCFDSFFSDIIATVIGGGILTFFLFLAKEKIFPLPQLTGRWYLKQTTNMTAYKPYENMILIYVVMIWCEEGRINGTAEKIFEKSQKGEVNFNGQNRTRANISGCIEKRYLGRDKIYIHMVEEGHGRESTHYYDLGISRNGYMRGTFKSMVANQEGIVEWQREKFI